MARKIVRRLLKVALLGLLLKVALLALVLVLASRWRALKLHAIPSTSPRSLR